MSTPRLVVTGMDPEGASLISCDAPAEFSFDVGPALMHQLWLTTDHPVDPAHDAFGDDPPSMPLAQPGAGGSLFQICTFHPHTQGPMHKTNTVDYVVVTAGSIDMEMQDGGTVRLSAGDCVVQRATVHRWSNPYDDPCTLAVTCISTTADPEAAVGIELAEDPTPTRTPLEIAGESR